MIQEELLTTRDSSFVSVSVLRGMIVSPCLNAVMPVTERLPVVLIPEQDAVASVRLDVIDICSLDIASLFHAFHAQRMRFKITLAGFVPCSTVTSAACGAYILRVEGTMLLTVFRTIRNKCCTAGMLAWCIGSVRH